jgi:hypothetical protein
MKNIRNLYQKHGVKEFYQNFGKEYRNPHEQIVKNIISELYTSDELNFENVLDLACGSGEVTVILQELGCDTVQGCDPYTYEAYFNRIGNTALRLSFEDIQTGALKDRKYSLIICSFALHLLDLSRLPGLIFELSNITNNLVVITPHKKPYLDQSWGFKLIREDIVDRVRVRVYESNM